MREIGEALLVRSSSLNPATRTSIKILESNVGFDHAKGLEDCHCEGKARSNLQPTKIEIASSLRSSQ